MSQYNQRHQIASQSSLTAFSRSNRRRTPRTSAAILSGCCWECIQTTYALVSHILWHKLYQHVFSIFKSDFWCVFKCSRQSFDDFHFHWQNLLRIFFSRSNTCVNHCVQLEYFIQQDPVCDLSAHFVSVINLFYSNKHILKHHTALSEGW